MRNSVGAVAFVVIVVLTAFAYVSPARAGIFNTITTIIGGHIDDIKSRTTADQIIEGYTVREGFIRDNDPGQDALHRASGDVSIVMSGGKYYIQLATNFTSTPGPDYHVYVSKASGISSESLFESTEQFELGRLIKGSGASYYEIVGLNASDVKSVTIWCKAFGEFIGSADL